jgi:hypothetical protein
VLEIIPMARGYSLLVMIHTRLIHCHASRELVIGKLSEYPNEIWQYVDASVIIKKVCKPYLSHDVRQHLFFG